MEALRPRGMEQAVMAPEPVPLAPEGERFAAASEGGVTLHSGAPLYATAVAAASGTAGLFATCMRRRFIVTSSLAAMALSDAASHGTAASAASPTVYGHGVTDRGEARVVPLGPIVKGGAHASVGIVEVTNGEVKLAGGCATWQPAAGGGGAVSYTVSVEASGGGDRVHDELHVTGSASGHTVVRPERLGDTSTTATSDSRAAADAATTVIVRGSVRDADTGAAVVTKPQGAPAVLARHAGASAEDGADDEARVAAPVAAPPDAPIDVAVDDTAGGAHGGAGGADASADAARGTTRPALSGHLFGLVLAQQLRGGGGGGAAGSALTSVVPASRVVREATEMIVSTCRTLFHRSPTVEWCVAAGG